MTAEISTIIGCMNLPPNSVSRRIVPIAWSTQRAEWRVRLHEAAAGGPFQIRSSTWNVTDGFYRLPVVTADGQATGVGLCFAPVDEGQVLTFVLSDGPAPSEIETEISNWIDVALEGMDGEPTKFGWYATIGTRHGPWLGDRFQFGNLLFEPASERLGRWERSERFPSLSGMSTESFSVLGVSGIATGHDWQGASRLAAGEIALAAGLLTVVTGQAFDVLGSPSLLTAGSMAPPIDVLVGGLNGDLVPEYGVSLALKGSPFELPGWIDSAWDRLHQKQWLASAVLIFLEGSRLAETHPSLAGVAFVAANEAIGTRVFDVEMCLCGQHRDTTARFRAAVALVHDDSSVVEAIADDYKIRSKLVHQGVLPGSETVLGGIGAFDPYIQDTVEEYEMGTLYRLSSTARALLECALRDELPPRRKLAVDQS